MTWTKNKIIAVIAIVVVIVYGISFYNTAIDYDTRYNALHSDTKNIFSKINNTMDREGFTLEKYSDDIIKAFEVANKGRYGETGAKGAMLWLKEQNPNIDADLYKRLNQLIEANYAEFANIQTRKLELTRSYNKFLRQFPNNVYAFMLRFEVKDTDNIVTSTKTQKAFETNVHNIENPFKTK